jgi:hypothetical protein
MLPGGTSLRPAFGSETEPSWRTGAARHLRARVRHNRLTTPQYLTQPATTRSARTSGQYVNRHIDGIRPVDRAQHAIRKLDVAALYGTIHVGEDAVFPRLLDTWSDSPWPDHVGLPRAWPLRSRCTRHETAAARRRRGQRAPRIWPDRRPSSWPARPWQAVPLSPRRLRVAMRPCWSR